MICRAGRNGYREGRLPTAKARRDTAGPSSERGRQQRSLRTWPCKMYACGLSTRDLSEIWPLHLFLDGVAERLRPASAREAVLLPLALPEKAGRCSGILLPAPRSQPSAAGSFLKQMKRRGLAEPVLVCTDGPPDSSGRWRSAFLVCLGSGVWRTRSRNIVGKGPKRSQAEVTEAVNAAYRAP